MKVLFLSLRLLWKRKVSNITIVLQVMLSIMMLAQLFVFITDHIDNMRAVNELPVTGVEVLSVFDYYTPDYAVSQIETSEYIDCIGKVYMTDTQYNNSSFSLVIYNNAIINNYSPELECGSWFTKVGQSESGVIQAIVSSEMKSEVAYTADIRLSNGKTCKIVIIGILKQPTRYLYPSGSASPEYFTAQAIIAQKPSIIIQESDIDNLAFSDIDISKLLSKNIFIFVKDVINSEAAHNSFNSWSKYGEIASLSSLVAIYEKETTLLINGGIIMFVIFFALAVTGLLGNTVIQSVHNRKIFTVYYLLGMNIKRCIAIEIWRLMILILIISLLSILAGQYGLLMLQWMTMTRIYIFYSIVFMYNIIIFTAVGAAFIRKLVREDIAESIKNLNQGE